jgi:hypothetical protein
MVVPAAGSVIGGDGVGGRDSAEMGGARLGRIGARP